MPSSGSGPRRELDFSKQAHKALDRLDAALANRLIDLLEAYAEGQDCDVKRLEGYPDLVRLRSGDYRIVVRPSDALISVLLVAHRSEVHQILRRKGY